MFDSSKIPIRASTQEHLDIEEIRNDLIILKDGACALVIATTAINFGLLSEKEQDATIFAYAALLNSLTFSIQIVVRSQKKDISAYLKLLRKAEAKETKKEIKEQIRKYQKFIEETVAKNEVLDKKFYLVIPMTALELGVAKAITAGLKRRKGLPYPKDYIIKKAQANLYPKRDHLLRQLGRLGLKGRQLKTKELIQLFYEIYNPESGRQTIAEMTDYQSPLVQAAQKDQVLPTSRFRKKPLVETKSPQIKEAKPNKLTEPIASFTQREGQTETINEIASHQSTQSPTPTIKKPNSQSSSEKSLQDEINHLVKESV